MLPANFRHLVNLTPSPLPCAAGTGRDCFSAGGGVVGRAGKDGGEDFLTRT